MTRRQLGFKQPTTKKIQDRRQETAQTSSDGIPTGYSIRQQHSAQGHQRHRHLLRIQSD
jgi:hypothetical protein